MEFRVLKYFLSIAREENISKAARELNVTQPTLSRQIMELEEEIGKQLFIRGGRKLELTADGMLLRKRAAEILELVDRTEEEFMSPEDEILGEVYIGGGETEAMRLVAQSVKCFQECHPLVKYHIYSGNADDVSERLDRGLLDFAVLIEPFDKKKYEYIKLPCEDSWGLLMRKDSLLARKNVIKPEDLSGIPLISSRQSMVSDEISSWLGKSTQTLSIVASYNLIYNAAIMVEEGVGFAVCLDKLLNFSGNNRLCFKSFEPRLSAGRYLVWKKYQVLSKTSDLFLQTLKSRLEKPVG